VSVLREEVIDSRLRLFRNPFAGFLKHRDLLAILVARDLEVKYRRVRFWPLWLFLQPCLAGFILALVFGRFVGISTEGVPRSLFYLAGFLVWNFFSRCFMVASRLFSVNRALFSRIYFPRFLVPLSGVIFNLIELAAPFGIFLLACLYMGPAGLGSPFLALRILAVPFLLVELIVLALGSGLCIAALSIRFRDIQFASGFLTQFWMFVTPVLYPMSIVPDRWKTLVRLNPMTEIMEGLRWAFFGTGSPELFWQIMGAGSLLIIAWAGLVAFNWAEYAVMDRLE